MAGRQVYAESLLQKKTQESYSDIFMHVLYINKMNIKMNLFLLFFRINADSNDLPWQYTVSSYPTIIFYPANRYAENIEI